VHYLGCHLQTWHHWTILVRGRQRAVCNNQPSDMSRCLASSGQHLVNGEGSSGSSSGSSRMVPPPIPQTNHWHGPDRVISRRCNPQWWLHSPDLNPPDFYLWGNLKDMVYGNNPQTIPDLKAVITAAIRAIPREECGRVIENFARRIQMCLQRRGAHL